ncbi:hypothetical protein OHB12_14665 [Nocardia sp. NBC_01730]|uniref:hypothetical protein n=1 Tax=Nocardia sp. NBC_01730 TaxID=2975998 RepID=UPI002E117922|nr:hypothetical protein OHB12_14665 [Nocardia sp. NBC_01730]
MDPLLLAAGTTLVTAMATDGWREVRAGAVALWRRVHPERAPAIEAELEEVRGEVLEARAAGNADIERELARDWQRRLGRLVAADPGLEPELRSVLDEQWTPALSAAEQVRVQHIVQTATVSGHGRVFQAGGDQYNSGT